MRRDKTLRSNSENLHGIPILDSEHSHANGILIAFVFFEKEGFQVIKEFLYKSNTIY